MTILTLIPRNGDAPMATRFVLDKKTVMGYAEAYIDVDVEVHDERELSPEDWRQALSVARRTVHRAF